MKYDAVVVGAGILGTFHAFELAKNGKKVVVLEKDPQPREATVRNFGQVVPSGFPVGRWHHYGRYSTELYKELQSKKDVGIHNNGSLYIASDPTEMAVLEEMHQRFMDADYGSQLYTKEQVLQHCDRIQSSYAVGGLYFPQEVSAESRRLIKCIQEYLTEVYDIPFCYNHTVIDLESNSSGVVAKVAGGKHIEAEMAFVCNGRDFQILYPDLFNQANIEVTKLQMMLTEALDFKLKGNILTGMTIRRYESFKSCNSYANLDPANAHPELAEQGIHVLFKQRPDGTVVLGDSHVYADNSVGFDNGFDEEAYINNLIIDEAKNILDVPNLKIKGYWSGYYAQMKGDEEIYEMTVDNKVHIITGIGGKGMTASAGYAKENIANVFALATP